MPEERRKHVNALNSCSTDRTSNEGGARKGFLSLVVLNLVSDILNQVS